MWIPRFNFGIQAKPKAWSLPDDNKPVLPGLDAQPATSANEVADKATDVDDRPKGGLADPSDFWTHYNAATKQAIESQRSWSAQQAQKQMDWQEQMSNTAYQRAAADMRAAGLNPYLLMSSGGGAASSPSGAMATTSSQDIYSTNDKLKADMAILDFWGSLISSIAGVLKQSFTP